MNKIYKEAGRRYMVECMGKPCDYYDKCLHNPVYCGTHQDTLGNGIRIDVDEFVKGLITGDFRVTFMRDCRRDDWTLNTQWNDKILQEFTSEIKQKFPEARCDYDALKAELQELGI